MAAFCVSKLMSKSNVAQGGGDMFIGYARCSTADQNLDLQMDALKKAGCEVIYKDVISGATDIRPGLQQALNEARDGDVFVCWKLDRLGRSLQHLINTITELSDRGIGFKTVTEAIDTTTPSGRLVMHIFAALAEFERNLIQQRTKAGLDAARIRGRIGGRPLKLSESQSRIAEQLFSERNISVEEIAQSLGVSRATIYRNLKSK